MKISFYLWALKLVAPVIAEILIGSGKEQLIKAGEYIKKALEILSQLSGRDMNFIRSELRKAQKAGKLN